MVSCGRSLLLSFADKLNFYFQSLYFCQTPLTLSIGIFTKHEMYDTYCRLTKKRQTNTNINTTYKTCICLFTQRETTIPTSLCRNYLHVRASVFRSHLSLTCAAVTCNKEQVVRRCFCRFIFSVRSNLVISTHVK